MKEKDRDTKPEKPKGDGTILCGYVGPEEYAVRCAHFFAYDLFTAHLMADHRLSQEDAVLFANAEKK